MTNSRSPNQQRAGAARKVGVRPERSGGQAEEDRRKGQRRERPQGRSARKDQSSAALDSAHYLVSSEWILMAPLMVLVLSALWLLSRHNPTILMYITAGPAIAIVAAARLWAKIERTIAQTAVQRITVMAFAIALPMALYGVALADWVDRVDLVTLTSAFGLMAVLTTISTVVLGNRLPSIVTANVSLWLPLILLSGSLASWVIALIGTAACIVTIKRQVKLDKEARAQIHEAKRRQARAEEILTDYEQTGQGWFWETDRRGQITYVSPTVADAVAKPVERLIGRPFIELFILNSDTQESERTLNFHLSARSSFNDLAVRAATSDDERWWSISGRPIHDDYKNFLGFRGSGSDLTEKRRSAEQATRLAHYDSLTGLANRFQMAQTLEKILGAIRAEHRDCAVFLLDLDRFKQVNDTLGHPAGDALLKQVSQRLQQTVGNAGRVGRLGGDEFQVILPGHNPREELAHLASRIIHNLSAPYTIEGHRVVIGASVGIALSPEDGVTSEALIRNADLALYAAKDGGRGRFHFYAEDLHSDAQERRQLEQDLRDTIAAGGLALYYQPVVNTMTEKITGFEALLRWTHPIHGPMSPAKFIPIAEDAGLIAPIGEWALRQACSDLAKWPESVRVAVNVSPLQFANPALPSIVTNAVAAANIAPCRLELEITESVFLNDDEGTEAMFKALKDVGVRLALDDFGTGYSSLGYLKKAPFDKIKIDQSFVRGATEKGSRNGAIISAIVSLAEALGMETTAEGVETLDELDLVRMLGCSHIQGYIYDKPLSAGDATARLMSGLQAIAHGPRSTRSSRQSMLRKVVLENSGQHYNGTIRNISQTGAMIEGLWNVPPGTIFSIVMSEGYMITATARWCQEDRMGVEFATPLALDDAGRVVLTAPRAAALLAEMQLRKAG